MAGVQHIKIQQDQDGMRLDRWLKALFPQLGQGQIEKFLRKGHCRVDGVRAKSNTRVACGQTIRIPPLPDKNTNDDDQETRAIPKAFSAPRALQDEIRASVIHKDDHVLVINKPSGLAVQGGSKTKYHLDGMLDLLKFDAPERPRLVHRLDRDTSGVMVLARTRKASSHLTRSFANREARKIYWALTHGVPRPGQGDIKLNLIKRAAADGNERVRPAQNGEQGALKAITRFSVLHRAGQQFAWVAFMPLTGRTHQIRAHALAIGHPIVGDGKYYDPEIESGGQLPHKLHLHSAALAIPHPAGGTLRAEAPLMGHMAETWKFLGFEETDGTDADGGDPFPE